MGILQTAPFSIRTLNIFRSGDQMPEIPVKHESSKWHRYSQSKSGSQIRAWEKQKPHPSLSRNRVLLSGHLAPPTDERKKRIKEPIVH